MKKMKYIFLVLIMILVTGCFSNGNYINKTEFFINEEANIDQLGVKLTKAIINENNVLEVVFSVTNNRDNSITIVPDNYFKLFDINMVQIPNQYNNNVNLIKKNQTVNYTLMYDVVDKEIYEIYFYSGIVENNIKFTITKSELVNE